MKARQIESTDQNMKQLENVIQEQLQKQYVTGVSHGAKAFCQVIKDKIDNFKGMNMSDLIADISNFADITLKNSPENLQKAFEKTQERSKHLLGKEDMNE